MEELPKFFSHVAIVGSNSNVYKNECIYSYDTAESETGLYINLKTFEAVSAKFLDYHFKRYNHPVYLNHKIIRYKLNKPESSEIKPKRLAIGLEGGFDPDSSEKAYRFEDTYSLVILPERTQIALPNPDLPELILQSISSIMAAESDELKEAVTSVWDGEKRMASQYAENLEQISPAPKIPLSDWKCERCDLKENLWLNLTDGSILCGRKFFDGSGGNNHAVEHYQDKKLPLAVKLGTITATSADVYSYPEDDMVLDPHLNKHLAHFGIDIQQMTKTEKSMIELEIDMNERVGEWLVIQEEGKNLEPVSGPGFTGLANLGNSCYMNSVLQVLFSIEDFKQFFYPPNAIYDASQSHREFNHQVAKLAYGLLSGEYSHQTEHPSSQFQKGIQAKSFKTFVCGNNRDFATKRQQDAHEFFLYLTDQIEMHNKSPTDWTTNEGESAQLAVCEFGKPGSDPTKCFEFVVEDRLECSASKKVKYSHRVETCLSLDVDLNLATNKEAVAEYEKKLEAKEKVDVVRPSIPLMSCIELSASPETLSDFYSSAISARTSAEKTSKISRFPRYFVFQLKKFVYSPNATMKKLDVAFDVPDILDLALLEGKGLQPGEEELIDEPEPSGEPGNQAVGGSASAGSAQTEPDSEAIATLLSMGIDIAQAIEALKKCNNDAQRAIEFIFDPDSYQARQDQMVQPPSHLTAATRSDPLRMKIFKSDDSPKLYQLKAFISHMGTSTACGHYVCHIRKDERWYIFNDNKVAVSENPPREFGYLYFYERCAN